jgi:hypothetical protein
MATTKATAAQKSRETVSANSDSKKGPSEKRQWNEIESLFEEKKKAKATTADKQRIKANRKQRIKANRKKKERKGAEKEHDTEEEWVDDGLGGKYNSEGYTGRVEDGVRVFKAHVLSKPNAGSTPLCPFDCNCCYI